MMPPETDVPPAPAHDSDADADRFFAAYDENTTEDTDPARADTPDLREPRPTTTPTNTRTTLGRYEHRA